MQLFVEISSFKNPNANPDAALFANLYNLPFESLAIILNK